MNRIIVLFLSLSLFIGCGQKEGTLFETPSPQKTGIDFVNKITETDDLNILDYLYFYDGGGVSIGDINNDDLPDIFFSGNQVKNRLFLNKGDLKFEDITLTAGMEGNSTWNTGAIMGDVNGDGLLDIYVCAVVGINGFTGFNELYINNGDLTFTESAKKYGLDFESYSSSAMFLDYDLDGDLDIYILNHAVHTQESFGRSDLRNKRNYQTGDKLMRNDDDKFTDVSEEAGIFGGVNGYGLGIAAADFNQDGYPDIYVSNDFHEDDYYYINNGDGTFSEKLKQYFGHTTRFSMGNDVADINHDGWPDIISLDMLPEEEKILKSSQGDESLQIQKLRIEKYGYHYQFTRNMLHINQQNSSYLETALLSGVAATDWSWSCLFADYNQDGKQDLFISNGIPKRPNDLDFIKFVSNEQIAKKINLTKLVDLEALDLMPSGKVHNYIFEGGDDIIFQDKSGDWIVNDTLISGATAMGDLDNDGDLDLVINNINSPASLYINKTNGHTNYLKLKLDYPNPNKFGIGTKVFSYHNGILQYKELYTVRGFQSSSEPIIHFGYGNVEKVDSMKIVWPDRTFQIMKNVTTNQTLSIFPKNTKPFDYSSLHPKSKNIFKKVENNLGINFIHIEDNYIDFNRQKLIPYMVSDRGPATSIGDINNDDKSDIFFGGSQHKPSKIYIQTDSIYVEKKILIIANDSIKEDVSAIIADLNNDGKNDLFIGSGGGDFYNKSKPLLDSYYIQNDSLFENASLPEYFENASVIKANDIDNDGDLDLFVASNSVSNDFGKIPNSFILINDKGNLSLSKNEELQSAGMITDAVWDDFDNDGVKDLVVVGEWMQPKFFKNNKGNLKEVSLLNKKLNGLWQSIIPFDIDGDGDMDYLLGNWGVNTKFKASDKYPMKMYYSDFDQNGTPETIITTEKILEVNLLQSGYLTNEKGNFTFVPFQTKLQVSPITAFLKFDFDNDGKSEVLAGGNYFGVKPFHGRFDSFSGALIKNENNIILGHKIGLDFTQKSVRQLNIIQLKNKSYLLVTINNDMAQVYELNN
jgi:hypothetical protein